MAQPSGQVGLASGYTSEYFYYAQGSNGVWDAKNSALLSKTGTAAPTVVSGANAVVGDGATYYSLPSTLSLTGTWTLIVRGTRASSGAGLALGDISSTGDFFGLETSEYKIRGGGQESQIAVSNGTTTHTYAFVCSGTSMKMYRDGALEATRTVTSPCTFSLNAILAGYSGAQYSLSGSIEFLNVIPGTALSDAQISARYADPYFPLAVGADATAPGATVTGTGTISAGSATGGSGAIGTFTFDACENNTHSGVLNNIAVNWTWLGGTVGSITSITNGSGTMTTAGMTISGLPTGLGCGILRTADGTVVAYQDGTVA